MRNKQRGSAILSVILLGLVTYFAGSQMFLSAGWVNKTKENHIKNIACRPQYQEREDAYNEIKTEAGWIWRLFIKDNPINIADLISFKMSVREAYDRTRQFIKDDLNAYQFSSDDDVVFERSYSTGKNKYLNRSRESVYLIPVLNNTPGAYASQAGVIMCLLKSRVTFPRNWTVQDSEIDSRYY